MHSILFLSVMNGDPWGGSEEQWFQLALWMAKKNYRVGVAVFEWDEKKEKLDELKKNGCTIYLIPNKGKGIFKTVRQQHALSKIPYRDYDMTYVNQGGWKDIAHGPFKSLYKKLPPYALSFHNYQLNAGLSGGKVNILNNWVQHSAVCIAATGVVFKMLEEEYKISVNHKEVSYSPPTFITPLQSTPYPVVDDAKPIIFLILSALDVTRKAQDVIIRALGNEKWKDRNWQLHIYGEGKDRQMLEQLISDHKLKDKVLLKGFTKNVKACLENCHLLVQATHFDAMPISVIEAMAMSRPCMVSSVGDMPEWVTQNYNGFLVEKVNEVSLNEALENAWNCRTNWHQMGLNAFDTFTKKYPQPFEEKFSALLDNYLKPGKQNN